MVLAVAFPERHGADEFIPGVLFFLVGQARPGRVAFSCRLGLGTLNV